MLLRDARLSDGCTSDRCSFSCLGQCVKCVAGIFEAAELLLSFTKVLVEGRLQTPL